MKVSTCQLSVGSIFYDKKSVFEDFSKKNIENSILVLKMVKIGLFVNIDINSI